MSDSWRDLKSMRAEGALLGEPLYQDWRPTVVEHVKRLQAARTTADLFEVQRYLLVEFWARQNVRDELRREIRQSGNRLGELARAGSRADVIGEQGRRTRAQQQERVFAAMIHTLRSLADGLAWKALRYDRLAIAVLGRGHRVGRLAVGSGLDAELERLATYWEHGILALHNDLTNVLRHGDLTLVRWVERSGETVLEADVEEVKAGRVNPNSAQMLRIADAIQFLQRGHHPTLANGRPLAALRLHGRYRTFQADLASLLDRAHRADSAWIRPSPCVAIAAIDFRRNSSRIKEVGAQVIANIQATLGWWSAGHEPFVFDASLRRMRDRRRTPPEIAPFAIFRLPPGDVADLLLGYLDFVTYLNPEVLESMFAARGLQATVARGPDADRRFLRARRGAIEVRVPSQLREQMLMELMTPATLIRSTTAALDERVRRDDDSEIMVVFDDESSAWTP